VTALSTAVACSGGASTALPREESLGHLALIDYLNGWPGRAERKALAAVTETERFSLREESGSGIELLVLAAVAVDRNELDRAQALLDAAADSHHAMRDPVMRAGRALATARLLLARGETHAALEAAEPAVAADVVSPWSEAHKALVDLGRAPGGGPAGDRRRAAAKRCPATSRRVSWAPHGPSSPRAGPSRRSTCSTECAPRAVRVAPYWSRGDRPGLACAGPGRGPGRGLRHRAQTSSPRPSTRHGANGCGAPSSKPDRGSGPCWARRRCAGWPRAGSPPDRRRATRGGPPEDQPPPPVVEELSGREHDVLERLAQMMSTEEIAADLYVSVNTVKTHLKSVYRKLSVNRRHDAVHRARELRLL
jgi:LuxR family maltose regulon positive regulatory protein